MNMRVTGSYPAGLTSPVDKRIGDAFPVIEEVHRYLDQLKYLAKNGEKFAGKQVEFRSNSEEKAIEWRYENGEWNVLVSFNELVGININSIEARVELLIESARQANEQTANASALAALTNHIADADPHTQYQTKSESTAALATKVDKVVGKGLSTEDFSTAEKTKLAGIANNANNYSHPNSGVSAGTYKSVTVNAQGHVTAGSNPTTLSGYGITDAAPSSHVGSTGNAHGEATSSVAGFMSSADKQKLDGIAAGAQTNAVTSVAGKAGAVTLVKGDVGLGNVDNTADSAKPVSTTQQAALNLKANLASPALTGTPTAPTASTATNTTQLATTAFVQAVNAADTGSAATAVKLKTARTLTVGSTGKSFDGSANVSWSLSEIGAAATSHTHDYLPLSGGTLTDALTLPSPGTSWIAGTGGAGSAIRFPTATPAQWHAWSSQKTSNGNAFAIGVLGDTFTVAYAAKANIDAGTNSTTQVLNVNSGGVSVAGTLSATGGFSGNAATATRLVTGRTIGMTGDVTWTSASFNGSGDVTGTATLANSGVTAGTYTKVTVDAKGRVTAGSGMVAADVPVLPANKVTQDAGNRFVTDAEKTAWGAKQANLVSGTNIKTINGESLLGAGDIAVSGGGQELTPAVNGGISISGGKIAVNFGTSSSTACVGNDYRLSNARPASDVSSWAKAGSKPSYSAAEVGAVPVNGGNVTDTLNMSTAPTNKINLGVLNLTGSSSYVGFGNGDFKFRVGADGAATSFGAFLISMGQIRADGSYTTTVAESANVNIGSTGYFRRSTSSLRYKDCVEDVDGEMMQAVIDNARPIWYRSLCKDDDGDNSWWGLGAEELGAIDPRFVHWAHPIVPTEIVEQIEFYEPTGEVDEGGNPITKTVIKEERRIENRPDTSQPVQAEGVMYDRLVVPLLWHAKKMQARIEALEARLVAMGGVGDCGQG